MARAGICGPFAPVAVGWLDRPVANGLVGLNDRTRWPMPAVHRFHDLSDFTVSKPANSGTTLDERMLLAPNGAVAVWGSSG